MNKTIKIIITIWTLVVIVLAAVVYVANNKEVNTGSNVEEKKEGKVEQKELGRIVMVDGKLYYDTGKESTVGLRCGTMDGKITSNIEDTKIPTIDGQSNFKGEFGYQYVGQNTIEVAMNDKWYVFETKEEQDQYSFYGKVIESHQKYMIVEPNEGEDIRKSADKIEVGLGENNDAIYPVGTNVKITYKGYVMESYPAKVDVVNIELKSVASFEIRFYDKQPKSDNKINKILDKSELDKYNYNIYTYEGSVNILINGEEISLRDAILNNKITMEEILQKAEEDLNDKKITGDIYKDGGSKLYKYDNYTIIKCHTLEGNRDVYIGTKDMTLNNVLK